MQRRTVIIVGLAAALSLLSATGRGAESLTTIPMVQKETATYYVQGAIGGYGDVELMVDTGAGYTTINEETLAVLLEAGEAVYVKKLTGVLADGSRKTLPVYRLRRLVLGNQCVLRDVEAAVLPRRTRLILGLSALEKAAPFVFSTRPPRLSLTNCGVWPAAGQRARLQSTPS
ncbi:MAG: clan AA aspartic protease [Gammaproteobacteria bacterium]|nr:clan AA aspartic protease [Gammaproteobacteria bacterium]NIR83108.1 clan AA aspartic protease [Gammaproteobacteria bacterium]NIR90770.1 clan AA aspartic protease [Gammaproteobacteria bacterium]NIU04261.1 clan AA aspartic protease [Gammaproteobacteria bacterium]NIV51553.1 hypothetical protein [Gammaproteobacteria bacterium]